MLTKCLTCMHITDMYFDERQIHCQQSIAQRDTGMCECPGVQDDEITVAAGLLNTLNQFGLCVTLQRSKAVTKGAGLACQPLLYLGQRRIAINVRLARPEQVQVRAIDAFVALDWLKNQPYVDPTKIFLHGHSHGAATILHVFSIVDPTGSDNTFAGGVAVSPLCGTFSDSENLRGPIVIFHGSKDRNAVTHECVIYRNDDAVGKNIYFEILEGASHNPTIDNSNKNYHPAMKEPLERFIEGIID